MYKVCFFGTKVYLFFVHHFALAQSANVLITLDPAFHTTKFVLLFGSEKLKVKEQVKMAPEPLSRPSANKLPNRLQTSLALFSLSPPLT